MISQRDSPNWGKLVNEKFIRNFWPSEETEHVQSNRHAIE